MLNYHRVIPGVSVGPEPEAGKISGIRAGEQLSASMTTLRRLHSDKTKKNKNGIDVWGLILISSG